MKKLYFLALGLTASVASFGQQFVLADPGTPISAQQSSLIAARVNNTQDTIMPSSFDVPSGCANTSGNLVYYRTDRVAPYDSGYWFGTNPYGITDLLEKFTTTGTANVTDVIVFAAKAHGTTATSTANIYNINPTTKGPNSIIGSSTPLPMSMYTTTNFTVYNFSTPVAVNNGTFGASITVPNFGGTDQDTLAIVTTKLGVCSTSDSLAWINAPLFGGWLKVKSAFSGNCDIMIFPIVDIPTGIDNSLTKNHLTLYNSAPNPASSEISINYGLSTASKVEIEIFDMSGKLVKSVKQDSELNAGKHTAKIELLNLSSGVYMYSVNANGTRMYSKFVVTK